MSLACTSRKAETLQLQVVPPFYPSAPAWVLFTHQGVVPHQQFVEGRSGFCRGGEGVVTRGLYCPPLFSHNAFILQNAMSAVEDISHPIPLTTEQMQGQVDALESALHVGRAERDAFGLADRARSKTGLAYVALSAERLALQQEVAKLQAERAVLARGPRASPAVQLPVPHRPGTSSVMRPVDEFLMRTMLDITSVLKSAAEKSAAVNWIPPLPLTRRG